MRWTGRVEKSVLSLEFSCGGEVFDRLFCLVCGVSTVSFSKRARKASIPSDSSSFGGGGGGGGGIAANGPAPGFGREGSPELLDENTEPRDALEVVEILELGANPLLLALL